MWVCEHHSATGPRGLPITASGHKASDATDSLPKGHGGCPDVGDFPERQPVPPRIPQGGPDHTDNPARKDKAALPDFENIQGLLRIVRGIDQDIEEPGPHNGGHNHQKSHIHGLLGWNALGFADSDGHHQSGQKPRGHKQAIGVQGKGSYGKKIWKHKPLSAHHWMLFKHARRHPGSIGRNRSEEQAEGHPEGPHRDRCVCHIECGPVIGAPKYIDKVNDLSEPNTIHDVTDGPPQNE